MISFYLKTLHCKSLYLILSVTFGILLLVVSLISYEHIERSAYPQISQLFDMMNHFFGFLIFNFFLFSSFLGRYSGSLSNKIILIYLLFGISWGLLCEAVQLFNETRNFQLIDVLANTTPSLLVYVVYNIFVKTRARAEGFGEIHGD
jgi:VanZ family protein